jgi:hypothetical protein
MLYQRPAQRIPIGMDHCVIPHFDPGLGSPVLPPQRLPPNPFGLQVRK